MIKIPPSPPIFMPLVPFLRKLKRKIYYHNPLIRVLIYKNNLLHNLYEYQNKFSGVKIAPVLKSNAYGHGLVEVARILDKEDIEFFVVDSIFEADTLRYRGIQSKILIIGYVRTEQIIRCAKNKGFSFVITSMDQLDDISNHLKSERNFHLKIDTGMHRQGILFSEIPKAIKLIKSNKNIILEGVCSHLADADNPESSFTLKQISNWNNAVDIFKKEFSNLRYLHLASTAGLRYTDGIQANVARLGLGLYGYSKSSANLKPVLEMRTIITSVKEISAGASVGYNASFKADQPMKIATIPAGYFEGIDLRLSNTGWVKMQDKFCKILGRVSMNIISIDVSDIPDIKINDKVIVISANLEDKNSVENNAEICETVPYEILVDIPQHLKREVI